LRFRRSLPPDFPALSCRHPRVSRRSANPVLPATGLVDDACFPVRRFSITASTISSHSLATVLVPLATILAPLATRHSPLATRHYLPRPSPWLLPDTDRRIVKVRMGPRSRRAGPLSHYAPNRAIPAHKSIRSFPLAAAHPLTVLSWPEALRASGSRRACRMHIGRNACSPVALLDFPEFAQAVRYGVPGTP
jgi:hypothetical protein